MSAPTDKPDWHTERQAWNAEDRCARKACQAKLNGGRHWNASRWWNTGSNLWYCGACARAINVYNPGLVVEIKPEAPTATTDPESPTPEEKP